MPTDGDYKFQICILATVSGNVVVAACAAKKEGKPV